MNDIEENQHIVLNNYFIINACTSDLLEEIVTKKLAVGYSLVGGLSVTECNGNKSFYQAMIIEKSMLRKKHE